MNSTDQIAPMTFTPSEEEVMRLTGTWVNPWIAEVDALRAALRAERAAHAATKAEQARAALEKARAADLPGRLQQNSDAQTPAQSTPEGKP